ncbi:MAG TPA: uracil-DNA glycosylase [Burkholderiales bacterium]|nr:uracil-DNA glycosylase [Burkholderiales bacterium]
MAVRSKRAAFYNKTPPRTTAKPPSGFDPECRDCPRLARHLDRVRKEHPDYHARPVAPFGPARAALLVVGLAPGMHGANRTGRPFTGDHAGVLLYRTLHSQGFASHEGSADPDDGLELIGCRVTNAVKCVPPQNKPRPDEVRRCNRYLAHEIAAVRPRAILALGAVAHRAVLMALGLAPGERRFAHHAVHELPQVRPGARLFDSYHCSRYNTQTKRLTERMFHAVVRDIAIFLRGPR